MRKTMDLEQKLRQFVLEDQGNCLTETQAIREELAGMRIYGEPILGAAGAGDPLFSELKKENAIGAHFVAPREWMPQANTVFSFFLPFTEKIKAANREDNGEPAAEWLHGRIEGQQFLERVCGYLKTLLEEEGGSVLIPGREPGFRKSESAKGGAGNRFTSNWSERHIAFVCGIGTFGLSKGLITKAGTAGRLGSLITDLEFESSRRPYGELYEYCSLCGACVRRCPAGAISLDKGKSDALCNSFVEATKERFAPRYGCGKCQTGVPCESGIPKAAPFFRKRENT